MEDDYRYGPLTVTRRLAITKLHVGGVIGAIRNPAMSGRPLPRILALRWSTGALSTRVRTGVLYQQRLQTSWA